MSLSEREVGQAFKTELEKQKFILVDQGHTRKTYETHFKAYLNKRVSTRSKKFKRFWQEKDLDIKDIPPSQPEIDMVLVDDTDILRAVEIKVIKETKRGVRPSYYLGLGQALAYLSFGFPQVALWLCYDGNSLDDRKIYEYNDAFTKIRQPVVDLLDVTYFKILREKEGLLIETGLYKGSLRWWERGIGIPQNEGNRITWVSINPFLNQFYSLKGEFRLITSEIRKRVETIYEFLKEQRKLWDKIG
jgi:hypothetical protein